MKLRGRMHNGYRRPAFKGTTDEERATKERAWSLDMQQQMKAAKNKNRARAKASRAMRKRTR